MRFGSLQSPWDTIPRTLSSSRDCSESLHDRERCLCVHPHRWWQVAVLFGATKRVRHSLGQAQSLASTQSWDAVLRGEGAMSRDDYWMRIIGLWLLRDVMPMKIQFHHENLLLVTRRSPPHINVWPRETNQSHHLIAKILGQVLQAFVHPELTSQLWLGQPWDLTDTL